MGQLDVLGQPAWPGAAPRTAGSGQVLGQSLLLDKGACVADGHLFTLEPESAWGHEAGGLALAVSG